MRLSVVKQSFFGPPGQYGRLVTRATCSFIVVKLDMHVPLLTSLKRCKKSPFVLDRYLLVSNTTVDIISVSLILTSAWWSQFEGFSVCY